MNDRHDPQRITWYFTQEKRTLAVVTVSGLLYNAGLLAGPLFEGRLVGTLLDVLNGTQTAKYMALLALAYLATIAAVQGVRCIKRLYVRRFANDINRRMKHMLYADLVHRSKKELDREGSGAVLTKAISDVDACAEGMRKFTTEIFDTGVAHENHRTAHQCGVPFERRAAECGDARPRSRRTDISYFRLRRAAEHGL